MIKKANYFTHKAALIALFVLGEGCLIYPLRGTNQFGFAVFMMSSLLAMPLYIGGIYLWRGIMNLSAKNGIGALFAAALLLAFCVFALFVAADCFKGFIGFVWDIILPSTSQFFTALIFAFAALYFSLKGSRNILKFSLVACVLVLAVLVFFLLAAADKYEPRNIFVFQFPKASDIERQSRPYLLAFLSNCIILPAFLSLNRIEGDVKSGIWGLLVGRVLLGICIISPLLLFGAPLSAELDYPFSSLVSTVTVGRLFTRLDGFAYFVFFASCLLKTAVILNAFGVCLKQIANCVDKVGISK